MIKKNDYVKVVNGENEEAKETVHVIDVGKNGTEIKVEAPGGTRSEFAYYKEFEGWKHLFKGLHGERCFSERGPTYIISPLNNT